MLMEWDDLWMEWGPFRFADIIAVRQATKWNDNNDWKELLEWNEGWLRERSETKGNKIHEIWWKQMEWMVCLLWLRGYGPAGH